LIALADRSGIDLGRYPQITAEPGVRTPTPWLDVDSGDSTDGLRDRSERRVSA